MKSLPITVLIVLSFLVGGPVYADHAAPDVERARQFILDGVARTANLLNNKHMPRPEVENRLRTELRSGFDVSTIAGFVLGPVPLAIDENLQHRYRDEFEELVVQSYTNRILAIRPRLDAIPPDIIRVTGATPVKHDQLIVHSEINRKGAEWVKIDWRLREREERPYIIDITVLGISQAEVYRSEFTSIMSRKGGGVEELIATLRRKSDELRMQ